MIEKAYAKLNISLHIKGKNPDGFHQLESVVLPIKLHDVIEVNILKGDFIYDSVICDSFALKTSNYNLCSKAIKYLREKFGFTCFFQVIIHKDIFVQAGLGGGSSDAATVIKCVQKLLKLDISDDLLKEMTAEIGCDVPFFLKSEPSIMTGLGEKLEPITSKLKGYVLLVKPKEGLATVETFNAFDNEGVATPARTQELVDALNENDLLKVKEVAKNDLQDVAEKLVSEIKNIRESLENDGFEYVQMTGSGSTVFAITKNKKLWKKMEKKYHDKGYEVERTTLL